MSRHFRESVALLQLGSFVIGRKFFHSDGEGHLSPDEQYCVRALKATSRSFAEVIQALGPELRAVVRVFYLVLRGLDAVEDDMTIDISLRTSLLASFHERLLRTDDIKLLGVGPSPEERDLLANFDRVVAIFQQRIEPKYQEIIIETTKQMAAGMIKMAAVVNSGSLRTVDELQEYAYYVAGLVGIGLSQLFAVSGTESQEFQSMNEASTSMGLFLQKTNIIRDFAEDFAEEKIWWPSQLTSEYVVEQASLLDPNFRAAALSCLNHMVTDAFVHCSDALFYLSRLRDQHNLRFCAIPQVMALATLVRCYNEPLIFQPERGRVKISRAQAADIFINVHDLSSVFSYYQLFVNDLSQKIDSHDPNSARLRNAIAFFERSLQQIQSDTAVLPSLRPAPSYKSRAAAVLLLAVVGGYWLYRRRLAIAAPSPIGVEAASAQDSVISSVSSSSIAPLLDSIRTPKALGIAAASGILLFVLVRKLSKSQ